MRFLELEMAGIRSTGIPASSLLCHLNPPLASFIFFLDNVYMDRQPQSVSNIFLTECC